jgi:hypothetical protein
MFVFKWGRWRKGDVQLEPGDRLRTDVKYPDVSKVLAMLPAPGEPFMPGNPAAPEAMPAGGGGKRLPGAPPAASPPPNPSEQDNRRPPDGRDPNPPDSGRRPLGQGQPAPQQLPTISEPVEVDAIFLSVAAALAIESDGRSRSGMVAYLQDQQGQVVPRYPDREKSDIMLVRLSRSAELGNKDLQPNEPAKPIDPVRPLPVKPDDRPPPGGSGGGGGGS